MLRIQSLHGLATLALTTGALLGCGGEDTRPNHGSMAGQLDRITQLTRHGEVELGGRSVTGVVFRDNRTGLSVNVRLRDAREAPRRLLDGRTVQFESVTAQGGDWMVRLTTSGFEDFVTLPERSQDEVIYDLALGDGVAGLRLLGDSLELLDADGAPRLRMRAPVVIGTLGARHPVTVSLRNCTVDRDTRAPWDRPVVAPGARNCSLHLRWRSETLLYPAVLDPSWTTTTNDLNHARRFHTASLLPDGTVIVAGGSNSTQCELYNPMLKSWANGNDLNSARRGHTATTMEDGSIVLVGGQINDNNGNATGVTEIERYYGQSMKPKWEVETVSLPASPNYLTRYAHTTTLLKDDHLLVIGGRSPGGKVRNDIVILSLDKQQLPPLTICSSCLDTPRAHHTATRLDSDRILIAGGFALEDFAPFPRIHDINALQLQKAGAPIAGLGQKGTIMAPRAFHTAAAIDELNMLVVGGLGAGSSVELYRADATPETKAEIKGEDAWSSLAVMEGSRVKHTMTEIGDGLFLVAGGQSGTEVRDDAVIFDYKANAWLEAGTFDAARREHTATVLTSGDVLLVGGTDDLLVGDSGIDTSVVFSRWDIGESCVDDGECMSLHCEQNVCCDKTCDGPCESCNGDDAIGSCTPLAAQTDAESCAPYLCDGASTTCPDSCGSDTDCVEGRLCIGDRCVEPPPPKEDGTNCSHEAMCGSGFCTDGRCCVAETCAPYRCLGDNGTCVTSCKTSFDCAEDAVCNSEGRCIAAAETLAPPSPSCAVARRRAVRPPPWWFALAAIGLVVRRRRRESRNEGA